MIEKLNYDKTFNKQVFSQLQLSGVEFDNCYFTDCDFSGCNLSDIDFINCRFVNCNFMMVKTATSNNRIKIVLYLITMSKRENFLFREFTPSISDIYLSVYFDKIVESLSAASDIINS